MAVQCKDLPEECWEIIFKKLGHHSNLQALILVCKRFLSIVSHIRTTFNLTVPAVFVHGENLSPIFHQFPYIKSIDLRKALDSAPRLLDQITMSLLSIQSLDISEGSYLSLNRFQVLGQRMNNLRVLKCSKMLGLSDENLAVLANSAPLIEELDISYPRFFSGQSKNVQTDRGIEMLSSKMKGLRKIDISGNQFVTDKSLIALSSNCEFLEEVVVKICAMITVAGIQFLVRNSVYLASLAVSHIDLKTPTPWDCFSCARCLSTLDIEDASISDEFLYSLSVSSIPLNSFTLTDCDVNSDGMAVLLKRYPSLKYLSLTDVDFLDDTYVLEELSSYFSKLTTIKLKLCCLTESTFSMLAKNCPLLEDVDMGNTIIGAGDNIIDFVSNPRIRSVNLSCNPHLSDKCLANLALAFPFVEMFDVSYCSKISQKGISSILNRCSNIRHLEINGCDRIKTIGKGTELPKLEVLKAERSGIDDKGLSIIGKRCYQLMNLDLEGCPQVTTNGLKKMLEDCQRLKEINLRQCVNVSVEIIDWMVFSRPSLKKIIPPSSSFPDVCQMQFYLRHGCYVWTPPVDQGYKDRKYCFNKVLYGIF